MVIGRTTHNSKQNLTHKFDQQTYSCYCTIKPWEGLVIGIQPCDWPTLGTDWLPYGCHGDGKCKQEVTCGC